MTDITAAGSIKRSFKIEEKNALCDLGYNANANYNYGFGTAFQNTFNLGVACNGITVAGINDGINPVTGVYTISGITDVGSTINNVSINMATILSNDTNANSFEGLEDVFVPTTLSFLSASSGNTTTTINFHSSVPGLHLLRYVPINTLGQRGNITYIYVHLYGLAAGCTIDNTCNLVNNGDFEQNTSLPDNISQLYKACGWQPANSGTPEYLVQGAVSTNQFFPLIGVPCNVWGYENDLFINATPSKKSYAAMVISQTNGVIATEPIATMLKTTLAVNTSYQLSFDVSLSDVNSSYATKMQAYLSDSPMITSSQDPVIANPSLLFTNPTFSTISDGWDHIVINIPPQTNNNIRYLAIGGLSGVTFQGQPHGTQNQASCPITSYNPNPNTTYYYVDNVKLVPLYGAAFNLPSPICSSLVVTDLRDYLVSCPTSGVFAGNGVTFNSISGLYSFQYPTGAISTTITYTYSSNGCPITLQKVITLASVTPTFNPIPAFCQGSTPPVLPTTSTNGITGTWNPSTVSNTTSGNYTFTPTAGQCATNVSVTTTVTTATITPTFNTIPVLCQGSTPPVLPTTSTNGITGTWNPSIISTTISGNYTFTPTPGQCAVAVSRAIQVLRNDAFITNADAFTVTLGSYVTASVTTPSVLINDTYNGGAIPATIAGVPYTLVLTGTPPTFPSGGITFNATTGTFTVAPNTTAGTYVYKYYLQNSCYNTAAPTVKIVINSLRYENQIGLSFCYGTTAANSGTTLYQGTTVNGVQTNSTNATITVINPTTLLPTPLPTGITSISANGSVNLAAGILPGQITFYYRICSTSFGSCTVTKTCVITIERTFFGNPDTITAQVGGGVTYNVRGNDTYRGGCGNTNLVPATNSNTTITNVVNAVVNNVTYYSINPANGAIQAGLGTIPTGTYILSYTLCDNANLNICQTVSVQINVPSLKIGGVNNIINNFDIEKTIISPNPASSNLTILFNDIIKEDYSLEFYDVLGRLLIQKQITKDTIQYDLDLSSYAIANYFIKIYNNENSSILIKTIIKQ